MLPPLHTKLSGGLDSLNDYGLFARIHTECFNSDFAETAGNACEQYSRYKEDHELLASSGLTHYRFGIEWARIEPKENVFDYFEIEHYRNVLRSCRDHGLVPIITLHHFTSPLWLIRRGGWEGKDTPLLFARYAQKIVEELGDLIGPDENLGIESGYICTLNELNTGILNDELLGDPRKRKMKEPWRKVINKLDISEESFCPWQFASSKTAVETIVAAHHQAVYTIKSIRDDIPVGATMASQVIVANSEREEGLFVRQGIRDIWFWREGQFWDELNKKPKCVGDFLGIQAYTKQRVGPIFFDKHYGIIPPGEHVKKTTMGYEYAPDAVARSLRQAHQYFPKLDLICTEFGITTPDDQERISYYKEGLEGILACINDGVPILGALAWSFLDNYEWEHGYTPKFGLVEVNFNTQKRTPRESFKYLGKVSKTKEI